MWILASDIDNTLTGDEKSLKKLSQTLTTKRQKQELFLILSTGRRIDEVVTGFEKEHIPLPDAVISQVGTEIYFPPFTKNEKPLPDWDKYLRKTFKKKKAKEFIKNIKGLAMQPTRYNTDLKLSVYLDSAPEPQKAADKIRQRVKKSGQKAYQVVWSSSRDLDIIPRSAGKANAIKYVIKKKCPKAKKIIVAGDSGNDKSMFQAFDYGIAVANAKSELKKYLKKEKSKNHYLAKARYAKGVMEGLKFFDMI